MLSVSELAVSSYCVVKVLEEERVTRGGCLSFGQDKAVHLLSFKMVVIH